MPVIINGTTGITDVNGTAAAPAITGTDTDTGIFFPAANTLAFSTGGTEDARFDASGNFGLGVTPSAWATLTGLQVKNAAMAATSNASYFGANWYYNAGDKYIASSGAAVYVQNAGGDSSHRWYNAPSGTAGNAITFTQAMTLDASGNLALGNTTSLSASSGRIDLTVNGTSSSMVSWGTGGTRRGYALHDGTDFSIASETAGALRFLNNGAERARIDSSGNFLVGTTTGTGDGITLRPRVSAGSTSQINFNRASTTTVGYPINFQNGGSDVGYISMSNSAVAYVTSSDYRLKNTVAPMTGALAKVAALKPCTYKWNADGSDGEGFIAHELAEVCPDAVVGEKDAVDADGNPKYQGIDTSFLVATLTAALQEMKAIVDAQAAEIAALKGNA